MQIQYSILLGLLQKLLDQIVTILPNNLSEKPIMLKRKEKLNTLNFSKSEQRLNN